MVIVITMISLVILCYKLIIVIAIAGTTVVKPQAMRKAAMDGDEWWQ
jgi:hypothetical protein